MLFKGGNISDCVCLSMLAVFLVCGDSKICRAMLSLLEPSVCLGSILGKMDGFPVLTWMQLPFPNLISLRLSVHCVSQFFLALGEMEFAKLP